MAHLEFFKILSKERICFQMAHLEFFKILLKRESVSKWRIWNFLKLLSILSEGILLMLISHPSLHLTYCQRVHWLLDCQEIFCRLSLRIKHEFRDYRLSGSHMLLKGLNGFHTCMLRIS